MMKENKNQKTNIKKGYFAVLGCLLIGISVGEFLFLPQLYSYLASYFHLIDPEITQDSMRIFPIIFLLTSILSIFLSIALFKFLGYRGCFALFLIIFGTGKFFISYTKNFWVFTWVGAITGGIGQGGCTILPVYCGWRYFPPEYKVFVSGIFLSSYALSGVPASSLALYLINPENIEVEKNGYFSEKVVKNLPYFYQVYGIGSFVIGMIGVFLITTPVKKIQEKIEKKIFEEENQESEKAEILDQESDKYQKLPISRINMVRTIVKPFKFSDLKIFKDIDFLNAYFILLIEYIFPHFGLFTFKRIGLEHKLTDKFIILSGILGSFSNAASRFIISILFKKFGYRFCAYSIMILQVFTSFFFIKSSNQNWSFLLIVCSINLCHGSQTSLYPLVTDVLFRSKGAFSYSILFSAFGLSSVVILLGMESLEELVGGIENLLWLLCGVAIIPVFNIWKLGVVVRKAGSN